MARLLIGVGAIVAMAGMIFWWKGLARADEPFPDPPPARPTPLAEPPSPPPLAAPERTREEKRFDRYDKDRDGLITREEYLLSRRKAFARLDRNGDGRLDFEEWAIKTSERFATADANRSRTLDRAEFATTAPKRKARPACLCPESDDKRED